MNATTTKSIGNEVTTILAIDLGKFKSVACAYDRSTAEARFTTIDTTQHEMHKLLQRLRDLMK